MFSIGPLFSTKTGLATVLTAALPAASDSVTVTVPPAVTALCSAAAVDNPRSNSTLVSASPMLNIVAIVVVPTFNTAVLPVVVPAVIVALAVKLVLLSLSVFPITVPPTAVKLTAVGAVSVVVSTV